MLIFFVLLQPGKSDAAAVFGGGANSAAFGPRGTQTVLAKVTITAAIVFFLTAFLFSIPGLFDQRSVGDSVTDEPAATAPAPTPAPTEPPALDPNAQPAVTPPPASQSSQNSNSSTRPQQSPNQNGNR